MKSPPPDKFLERIAAPDLTAVSIESVRLRPSPMEVMTLSWMTLRGRCDGWDSARAVVGSDAVSGTGRQRRDKSPMRCRALDSDYEGN